MDGPDNSRPFEKRMRLFFDIPVKAAHLYLLNRAIYRNHRRKNRMIQLPSRMRIRLMSVDHTNMFQSSVYGPISFSFIFSQYKITYCLFAFYSANVFLTTRMAGGYFSEKRSHLYIGSYRSGIRIFNRCVQQHDSKRPKNGLGANQGKRENRCGDFGNPLPYFIP